LCHASRLQVSILSLVRNSFFSFSFLLYIRGQEGESAMDKVLICTIVELCAFPQVPCAQRTLAAVKTEQQETG
jgi:hypothetical protein